MKRTISPLLGMGLLIFALLTIIERFIVPISNFIAIPLLIAAIVLIIIGGFKNNGKK
ncbi:MAG: hypothetical protein K0S55_505 [Clostridia bacterium]|nr:hypothetical protein [Clostridia bacterium]